MIESAIRFVEHGDVPGILPARTTLAAGVEETQECKRIHVVRAPRSAHKSLEVHLGLRREERLPLHVAQADGDTEILFPLRLKPLGEGSILRLRVEGKLHLVHRKSRTRKSAVRVCD